MNKYIEDKSEGKYKKKYLKEYDKRKYKKENLKGNNKLVVVFICSIHFNP